MDLTDGKRIKYQGTDGTVNYAFDIELYDEISKEESKYTLESRNIFLNLKKKTSGPYWPRLVKDEKNIIGLKSIGCTLLKKMKKTKQQIQ